MRNIKTRYLKTAMHNIATRIRTDLVLHVAFVKQPQGGHYLLWLTEAGSDRLLWQVKHVAGMITVIDLPDEFVNEL